MAFSKLLFKNLRNIIEFVVVNMCYSSHEKGTSIIYLAGITLQLGRWCGLLLHVVLTKFCSRGPSGGSGYVRSTVFSPSEAKLPFLQPLSQGLVFCLAAIGIISWCAHFRAASTTSETLFSGRDGEVWWQDC